MDILEKFKRYMGITPKENILADIKHAKRYNHRRGGGVVRKR